MLAQMHLTEIKARLSSSPIVANFPHHIHMGSETQVVPGQSLGILEIIEVLEREVSL